MAPRLKVFVTTDGLTDYVVAVSSRAKALAAWGVRQDLFKEGAAHETEEPELVAAATARPGEVLRRPSEDRAKLAHLKPAKLKPKPKPKPEPKPKPPSRVALAKVAALERKLTVQDEARAKSLDQLESARRRLAEQAAQVEQRHRAARRKIEADLEEARRALELGG